MPRVCSPDTCTRAAERGRRRPAWPGSALRAAGAALGLGGTSASAQSGARSGPLAPAAASGAWGVPAARGAAPGITTLGACSAAGMQARCCGGRARGATWQRGDSGAGRASTERPSLLRRLTGSPRARPERVLCTGRAVCGEGPEAGGAGAEVAAEVLARDQQPEGGAFPGRAGGDPGDDAGARPRPRREGARACA